MNKAFYSWLLSIFLIGNSIIAVGMENSATGIRNMLSELQPLKNGALQAAVLKKVKVITEDSSLDNNSKVVFLDVLERHTGAYSPQSSLPILKSIENIIGEDDYYSERGYGIYLWWWMYDSEKKDIKEGRYDIDITRSMISKLYGTSIFDEDIKPVLIKRGLGYYIPAELKTEQFQWHK